MNFFSLDGELDYDDVLMWLAEAGFANIGAPYQIGDANLDGIVDALDYIAWNDHKFTGNTVWSQGDFNADSLTDALDFIAWNDNKFEAAALQTSPNVSRRALEQVAVETSEPLPVIADFQLPKSAELVVSQGSRLRTGAATADAGKTGLNPATQFPTVRRESVDAMMAFPRD